MNKSIDEVLSISAKVIIESGKGYRNNDYGDGNVYSVLEIMDYEIEQLGNQDLLQTCKLLYGTVNIKEELKKKFESEKGDVYGFWLTTKQGVIEYYVEDEDFEIDEYDLPSDFVILSDLDKEGILIATQIHPDNFFNRTVSIR